MSDYIRNNTYEYLKTIVNHFKKNSVHMNIAMEKDKSKETKIINCAVDELVDNKRDLAWFELIFDLYHKMNKIPTREDFEIAMKNSNFNKISQKCQEKIKEKYEKFYAK